MIPQQPRSEGWRDPLNALLLFTFICMSNIRGARVVMALYALDLGAGPVAVGVLQAIFSAIPAMLAWPVGKWGDRAGSHLPLLGGCVGLAAAIVLPYFFHSMAALFAAAVVNGLAFTLLNVTQQNTVGMMSSPQRRTKDFANLSLVMSLGQFTGPLIAGFAIDHIGFGGACLLLAALGLPAVAALELARRHLPKGARGAHKKGGGMLALLRDRTMLRILMVGSVVMAGVDVFSFYVPVYTHGLGLSATTIGIIIACFAAAAFISRAGLSWAMQRATPEEILRRAFLLAAVSFALVPLFSNAWVLSALSFLYGFGLCLGQPITMTLSFSNSSDGRTGEVMGLRQSVNHGTRVVAPLVFGAIGSVAGLVSVFFVAAAMLGGGALMLRRGGLSGGASP